MNEYEELENLNSLNQYRTPIPIDILRYKDIPLYVIDVPTISHTYREFFTKIPYGDFKRIKHASKHLSLSIEAIETLVFRDYVLPKGKYSVADIESLPAGVVSTVVNVIFALSDSHTFPDENGDLDTNILTMRLNNQRWNVALRVELQIYTTICQVFKAYTFEDLDRLPFDKVLQLFACAERHLMNIGAIREPLSFSKVEYDPKQGIVSKERPEAPQAPQKPKLEVRGEVNVEDDLIEEIQQWEAKKAVVKEEPVGSVIRLEKPKGNRLVSEEEYVELGRPHVKKPEQQPELTETQDIFSEFTPVLPRKDDPKYEEKYRKEMERIRMLKGEVRNKPGYIPPKHQTVEANKNMKMSVPGIDTSTGWTKADLVAPTMSDEEAFAMSEELGFIRAGIEHIVRKEKVVEISRKEELLKAHGNKPLTLKDIKKMREQLKNEGKG